MREPDSWWVVLSQWLTIPIVAPILLVVLKDELVWPHWLAFWINANFKWDHERRLEQREELLKRLLEFPGRLPADFKFDRDEANAR